MTFRLRVTLRAAAEIEKANDWWLQHREAAPDALRADLVAAFNLLVQQAEIGTPILNARLTGLRRLHLGRLGYFVYYRVKAGELAVLSFWHSSRGRGPRL